MKRLIAVLLVVLTVGCDDDAPPGPVADASTVVDASPAKDLAIDAVTGPDSAPPDPDGGADAAAPGPDAALLDPDTGAPDETPPTVRFIAPMDGADVAAPVQVVLDVLDANGVARVTLVLGDEPPVELVAPYTHVWEARGLRPGAYDLVATAWDEAGNEASDRAQVQLAVDCDDDAAGCPDPPTVRLEAPDWLVGPAEVEAFTESVAVDFLLDGDPAATDDAAPFRLLVPADDLEEGPHTVTARVVDAWGQVGQDEATVGIDRTPPTLAFIAPDDGAVVAGPTRVEVDAADGQSLEAVELYVDGALLGPLVDGAIEWVPPYAGGVRTLRAVARDAAGLEAAAERTVDVDHPLTIEARRCAEGACVLFEVDPPELAGAVRFEIDVTDDDAPPQVVVLLVDDERHRFGAPPYTVDVDTTALEEGPHAFVASVAGARGNVELRRGFVVNNCDLDHDGHLACGGPDCEDDDPNVHPDAEDPDADGTDQDCDGHDGPVPDMAIPDAGPDAAPPDAEVGDPGTGLPRQNPYGPVSRVVHLEVPADVAAARAAGCEVVGANAGTTLGGWLERVGQADLDRNVAPDENGDSTIVMLTHVPDWPLYAEAAAVGRSTVRSMAALRVDRRTLLARASLVDPDDPGSAARIEFPDTAIAEDGTFRTEPGPFLLPFPLADRLILTVELEDARLAGRLAVDAPSLSITGGRVEGYWTEAAITSWVAQLLAACQQPGAPANLCNILRFALPPGSDPRDGIPVLKQFLGGFDVDWVDGAPVPCDGDCDSISVCFLLEGAGSVAHGLEGEGVAACEAACDRAADCAALSDACATLGERDWVEARAGCLDACDDEAAAAADAALDCAARLAALPAACPAD